MLTSRVEGAGPTGYTPCELRRLRRRCFALCIVSRCAHGAICARLACASTDSLALDYVACGRGRSVLAQAPKGRQQKEATAGGAFIWDFDALRQYFRTLRLTSELVDLRVGNANLFSWLRLRKLCRVNPDGLPKQKRDNRKGCRSSGILTLCVNISALCA